MGAEADVSETPPPAQMEESTDVRDSGVVGRDFVKSPSHESAIRPEPPKPTAKEKAAGWMSKLASKMEESLNTANTAIKEAATAKGLRSIRQQMAETVGIGNKTVDVELQQKVTEMKEGLHDLRVCAELVSTVSKTLNEMTKDSLALSACFQHLAGTTAGAEPDLDCHHRIQDVMSKNALCLVEAFDFFKTEIAKFCAKDIAEAQAAVARYEKTRVEYDACRMSFESLKDTSSAKLPAAEAAFLESYNTLSDVRQATWAKLCNVDENKVKFFKVQLKALANAYQMYLSGNTAGFEDAMAKLENPDAED